MSWIGLVGASPGGSRALQALRQRGGPSVFGTAADVVVIANRSQAISQAVMDVADQIVFTDITDADVLDTTVKLISGWIGEPALLVAFTELAQRSTAVVAERRGLPTVGRRAVELTRNKGRMRAHLENTPWAWPYAVGPAGELGDRLVSLTRERPWIVKPEDGLASNDIAVVPDSAAVAAWVEDHGADADRLWIAEELADGIELSVEAVSHPHGHDILAVTEKVTTGAPRFVEIGHATPPRLPAGAVALIGERVGDLLTRLGITRGASHTEVRWRADRSVMLIETHTRTGGDGIPDLAELVSGRDQYTHAIASLVDEDVTDLDRTAAVRPAAAGVAFLCAPQPGRLRGVVPARPDGAEIVGVELEHPPGTDVRPPRCSEDRIGQVMFTASSSAAALDAVHTLTTASTVLVD